MRTNINRFESLRTGGFGDVACNGCINPDENKLRCNDCVLMWNKTKNSAEMSHYEGDEK